MKKIILLLTIVLFFSTPNLSADENIVRPPKDLKGFVGGIISFTDRINGNVTATADVWHCFIVGVSSHQGGMGESKLFYLSGIKFYGCDVKYISYNLDSSGEWWQIVFESSGKVISNNKIKVISLQEK